ncbi:TonB-dependent receptor [Variovorax sp. J22P240]|uniref:TonB-dependent receptor n=1 Tax=Variovorax sp. J22P240 TaxID=3053514 RepID=UPI0025773506|nr:TonB-dependent receptor [Variovorax sp. J22P240]MDL9997842.1 TonB-dependent receptor [Variovorax sp. J22P240]
MSGNARAVVFSSAPVAAAALLLCHGLAAHAQVEPARESPPAAQGVPDLPTINVIAVTPLPGLDVPRDQIPSNVQTATGADMERFHSLDLSNFLARAIGGVTVNETQGNPFQPDINYRGFTASPLLGTPQGLSVFLDGVRLNQPFGDVVSWDLFSRTAIASIALMPGSNPLFGLNTLGGALSIQTKDGIHYPGTSVQVLGGSYGRAAAEFETGGYNVDNGVHWYVTGNVFHEDGWRTESPSDLRQLFAKVGHKTRDGDVSLTVALADNDLTGNGVQEQGALQRDWASVRTIPDNTQNRSAFLNLATVQALSDTLTLSGNVYYRNIRARTFNGDINDDSLDQAVYQPNAAERAALAAAGYTGFPTSGENASNTPFPKWRCIANALLNDEPNEKCNGLINQTQARQTNYGLAGQLSAQATTGSVGHQFVVGAAYDASRVTFTQGAQFGYINPDRTITPVFGPGAFADGSQSSEDAFDARVDLSSRSRTGSIYATDTMALNTQTHLTLSGRYNHTSVTNVDGLTPGGGPGSLDGEHTFSRFNPAVGLTFAANEMVTFYAGANQGSRAPTAIELGCADPASPCKLPNSFAGDPPLKQVVTTTFEAGLRGTVTGTLAWNFGVFRSDNRDDLLFVSDSSSGFGYFKNFGKTRRQGVEMGLLAKPTSAWTVGGNLSLLDATYRSTETIDGSGNSSNSSAVDGFPGTEGTIQINPGDRIPQLPRQILKLYADWEPNASWRIGADMNAVSGTSVRGNENGLHTPDGLYYTGPGRSGGYAVFNLGVDYKPKPGVKLFVQITNLFDRKYTTGGLLGTNGFTVNGNFIARPLPANANGDFPVNRATLFSPGAPRTAWVGLRYTFGA